MVIPRYLCSFPRMLVIFANLPIFRINVNKDSVNNSRVNMLCIQVIYMTDYDAFLVVNNIVHDAPVVFIFMIAHFF